MTRPAPKILLSAGDASGDHHAAALAAELRARVPDVRLFGFGGAASSAAGVELLEPLAQDPVMGFAAVLPALGRFVRLLNAMDRLFASGSPDTPDVVVPVDYPGFNVRLARLAKRHGIPVVYYVCPQYWGWAPWRVRRFADSVDLVLTTLPFEREYLERAGIAARHVGHPLADQLASAPNSTAGAKALAILPGSRRREVDLLLRWQLHAAQRLRERGGAAIPVLTTHPDAKVRASIESIARAEGVAIEVRDQPLPALLAECRAAIATSGTATLECALLRVPSVIVYRVNGFSLAASRVLVTSPWIGLPNLLAGHALFPEHVAAEEPADQLAADLAKLWDEGPERARCLRELDELRRRVLVPGAASKAADAIVERLR